MSNKSPVVASSFEAQIPAGHRSVEIAREPVELYKILKFEGLADNCPSYGPCQYARLCHDP